MSGLTIWTRFFFCPATFGYINNNSPNAKIHFLYSAMSGLDFFWGPTRPVGQVV